MTSTQSDQLEAIYNRLFELKEFVGQSYYIIYENTSGVGVYICIKDDFSGTITKPGYYKLNTGATATLVDDDNLKITMSNTHTANITFKRKGTIKK